MKLRHVLTETEFDDDDLNAREEMNYAQTRLKMIQHMTERCQKEFNRLRSLTTPVTKVPIIRVGIEGTANPSEYVLYTHYIKYFSSFSSGASTTIFSRSDPKIDPVYDTFKKLDKQLALLAPDGTQTVKKLKSMMTRAEKRLTLDRLGGEKQENDFTKGFTTPPKKLLFDYTRPDVSKGIANPYYIEGGEGWFGKPQNFDWSLLQSDVMIYDKIDKKLRDVGVTRFEVMYVSFLSNSIKYAIVGAGGVKKDGLSAILENSSEPDGKLYLRLANSALHVKEFLKRSDTDQIAALYAYLKKGKKP